MLRDDLPVRAVEHRIAVRALGPPPAPGPDQQEPVPRHGLHGGMSQSQILDLA